LQAAGRIASPSALFAGGNSLKTFFERPPKKQTKNLSADYMDWKKREENDWVFSVFFLESLQTGLLWCAGRAL